MSGNAVPVFQVVVTAAQNLGFAFMIGALLCERWLRAPGRISAWQTDLKVALGRMLFWGALLALATGPALIWQAAATMADVPLAQAGEALRPAITQTHFGQAWAAGMLMLGLAFLLAVAGLHPARDWHRAPLWLCLALYALTKSTSGHAARAGSLAPAVWADWVHVLAIGTWVGIVLASALLVVPRLPAARRDDRALGAQFVRSLSGTAGFALLCLVASGAYAAWHNVGTLQNLMQAAYGHVLLIKLALVACAAALGGYNRMVQMPRLLSALSAHTLLPGATAARRFARVLRVEALVLAGVLAAAAVLVSSMPPGAV